MKLKPVELDALRSWKSAHPEYWKQNLRCAWEQASYPGVKPNVAYTLQSLRNASHFGLKGLNRFTFNKG